MLSLLSPAARRWLRERGADPDQTDPIPGDASGRRYWRLPNQQLFMHAPPPEDVLPFLRVQHRFMRAGLAVPKVMAVQLHSGFMLLEDLGGVDLKAILDADAATEFWMQKSLALIVQLQQAGKSSCARPPLPNFSRQRLGDELALFTDWYLGRHRGLVLDVTQRQALHTFFASLMDSALNQPEVWTHRDFHARNLMVQSGLERLAMIDFQDAVSGPWTYDLASLLWDRYWDWGQDRRRAWIMGFRKMLLQHREKVPSEKEFLRSVEWMALQRNLKILGIFCRLAYRDGKQDYLGLLPQFQKYVLDGLAVDPTLNSYLPLFRPWLNP
ncbi:MAG: aminoglycoside phosphotransferase family protein [Acidithiobacillus sp.]